MHEYEKNLEELGISSDESSKERYDNIIGYMGTPDGFMDGLGQLEQLAEDGYVVAQRRAGYIYSEGENGIATDIKKGVYWLEKAASQEDVESCYKLGYIYGNKKEVKDDVKSFYWYKKGAEKGDGCCNNSLGVCYILGVGTRKNAVEAAKCFEIAANAGNTAAYRNVGRVYQYEKEVMDYDKAFYWYKKAAEAGDAYAYNDLGVCYQNGIGTIRNIDESFSWYKKAANAGNIVAYRNLGLLYQKETKDLTEAFRWFKKAADAGNTDAYNDVAIYYQNGRGTARDLTEAVKWYEKAVEAGNKAACYNLGLVYENEDEVKDLIKAYSWYEKAADAGNPDAMYKLGKLCENNFLNETDALQWYEKAVKNGNKKAREDFDRLLGK